MNKRNTIITNIVNKYFNNLLNKLHPNTVIYNNELLKDYHYCSRCVHYLKFDNGLAFKLIEDPIYISTHLENNITQRLVNYNVNILLGKDSNVFKLDNKISSMDIVKIYTNNKSIINNITDDWDIEFNYVELLKLLRRYI